ncbi:hypothetical protein CARN8_1580003 [mine drainage metagenome]|uniref:Transposase n=1 Tax=mine drainage metagenome TaxID=410659 RepID=A0A3P3ZLU6_9ZZZZ
MTAFSSNTKLLKKVTSIFRMVNLFTTFTFFERFDCYFVGYQHFKRQCLVLGNFRQNDTHHIRYGQPHICENCGSLIFKTFVNSRSHKCIGGHITSFPFQIVAQMSHEVHCTRQR